MRPSEYLGELPRDLDRDDWRSCLQLFGKPVGIFAPAVPAKAMDQFFEAMSEDFVTRGALMPDVHAGYTLPIGSVIETKGVLVPSYVGYDIGCGMCAMRLTTDPDFVRDRAAVIHEEIHRLIPTGHHVHEKDQETPLRLDGLSATGLPVFLEGRGFRALGTLGGGNHFIEVGEDGIGQTWIVIHSGSRGPGHNLAGRYMMGTGKVEGLFPILEDSLLGIHYANDLEWMLTFALENRLQMIHTVARTIEAIAGGDRIPDSLINRNHNHAERVGDRWIHRKGATHAEAGMLGVIPGNMKDGSFIVKGKGNERALRSSSHGAGRVMGRYQAKRSLDVDTFVSSMRGIVSDAGPETLDEDPRAYKAIQTVMELQSDLVEVIAHVRPILNVKG